MNRCVPDWNFEADFPVSLQKKTMGPDNELVELLWQNGQVVLSSQTSRKFANESRQVERHDQPTFRGSGLCGNSSSLVQDDETMSWIHYPLEDSFDKDLCSNFFSELPSADPIESDKPVRQFEAEEKIVKFSPSTANHVTPSSQQTSIKSSVVPEFSGKPMPPPRFQFPDSAQSALQNPNLGDLGKFVNLSQFPNRARGDLGSSNSQCKGKGSGSLTQGEVKESSVMTVVSSHCGSNQVPHDPDLSSGFRTTGLSAAPFKGDVRKSTAARSEKGLTATLEPTVTSSSSGGSGSSFCRTEKQSTSVSGHKRKGGDPEESECQSKAAELDSSVGKKPVQRSGSTRRSRAAEVHNLSERRRRDRINEKMKALQDLIPHCNKTDKASMLDEAIEYLKSLQLQLQVMWMGSGMAPMMFPGVQHYMSRMSMGMGPPPLPSIHNAMHLPRIPLVDQSISVATPNQPIMCQTPVLGPVNCPTQMQNPSFSEQYARYMQQMQTATQSMNMFRFGTHSVQQSQMMVPPGSSNGPLSGGAATDDAPSGKTR